MKNKVQKQKDTENLEQRKREKQWKPVVKGNKGTQERERESVLSADVWPVFASVQTATTISTKQTHLVTEASCL